MNPPPGRPDPERFAAVSALSGLTGKTLGFCLGRLDLKAETAHASRIDAIRG